MKKEIERYEQEMQEKHNASVLQAIKEPVSYTHLTLPTIA